VPCLRPKMRFVEKNIKPRIPELHLLNLGNPRHVALGIALTDFDPRQARSDSESRLSLRLK
jgi:hypothetical protein